MARHWNLGRDREGGKEALYSLDEALQTGLVALHVPDGPDIPLPESVMSALQLVVRTFLHEEDVILYPKEESLSMQEGADLLGVSRRYLGLRLDEGRLPSYYVGTHRRVKLQDLLEYRKAREDGTEPRQRRYRRKEPGDPG